MNSIARHAGVHAIAVAAGLALGAGSAIAAEDYATWDSFNGMTAVSPGLWTAVDRTRIVKDGVAQFVQRDLGDQTANTGAFNSSWGMNVRNPGPITQMRAAVTVRDYLLNGCSADGANLSEVQARLVGAFFNAGPGMPTSRINDIGAVIRIKRSTDSAAAFGTMQVEGVVFQCTVADCNSDTIALGTADLGTVGLNTSVSLKMEWEPANNRFAFYRDSNPVQRVGYEADDSLSPYVQFRQIGTRTSIANCASGARAEGMVSATFDGFNVNVSGLP